MHIKVSDAVGVQLDWLVAKCEGADSFYLSDMASEGTYPECNYSTDWEQGGPIIEREKISVWARSAEFAAESFNEGQDGLMAEGPTPLVAAMRCWIVSKLGGEVEVPSELVTTSPTTSGGFHEPSNHATNAVILASPFNTEGWRCLMNLPNYPSASVKEFGERVVSALVNASCQSSMGGLGGCKLYDLSNFDTDLHPYINAYLEGKCDSAAIMYAAMHSKELEEANEQA